MTSSGQRPRILLNILQYIGHSAKQRICSGPVFGLFSSVLYYIVCLKSFFQIGPIYLQIKTTLLCFFNPVQYLYYLKNLSCFPNSLPSHFLSSWNVFLPSTCCIQLIHEQHGFELLRSVYMWIFFSVVNTAVLRKLQLIESADTDD